MINYSGLRGSDKNVNATLSLNLYTPLKNANQKLSQHVASGENRIESTKTGRRNPRKLFGNGRYIDQAELQLKMKQFD